MKTRTRLHVAFLNDDNFDLVFSKAISIAEEARKNELLYWMELFNDDYKRDDEMRIKTTLSFFKDAGATNIVITPKPLTIGCENAAKKRFNVEKHTNGIALEDEIKTMILTDQSRKILIFSMPANINLPSSLAEGTDAFEITRTKVIPYTVNPATILTVVDYFKQFEQSIDTHYFVHEDLMNRTKGFLYNNCGSRNLSVAVPAEDFPKQMKMMFEGSPLTSFGEYNNETIDDILETIGVVLKKTETEIGKSSATKLKSNTRQQA